ncbi:MAG TPA: TrkA C-terminal domain-containing protein, partial [Gammaproteobacteria bacterium]|nr:TrkA C-terminal domain-containing protein [Gammaproteobacteria bacterium]
VGKSIKEANLRAQIGASVIALLHHGHVIPNPKSDTRFEAGDMVGVIGTVQELVQPGANNISVRRTAVGAHRSI